MKDQFDIRTLMVGDALVVGLTSCMVMGFTIKGYIDVSDGFKRKNVLVTRLGCWWEYLPSTSKISHQSKTILWSISYRPYDNSWSKVSNITLSPINVNVAIFDADKVSKIPKIESTIILKHKIKSCLFRNEYNPTQGTGHVTKCFIF